METKFVRTDYVLYHKKGNMSFSSVEQCDAYVSHLRESVPELDLSDARLFKIVIYSTDKTF